MEKNVNITTFDDNIKIYQLIEGFRFSVDPIILVDFFEGNCEKKILDIGSGSGIIPILLAKRKNMKNITGIEIQKESLDIFRKNVLENNLEKNIEIIYGDVKEYNKSNYYDYIISNPPYMTLDGKKISENENKKISRHEIKLDLSDLIKNSKRLLKPRGELFLVHRSFRLPEIITELEKNNFSLKKIKFVYFDRNKNSNLILIQASKGRKNKLEVVPPLFLEEEGY
ncbi:MAG: tRNA (adenine(22)-N(1))-methyltransferase TrmK [Fusobacterium perfoetens]|uniref:tRNA1(Val) (adenine(37)-N6)-methyltransferase n=1 Tax=Fusobacterium perfoetens TaxID=852 RepID=UPI0023F552A2|nr:methyltransferase [Fusobacterium perfoetens]MCI6153308.1 tRNA (adenine(22)-N(1))-methyltransferase TrmK [Fusobacterium perfoetens]MDY3237826.1 methyltransferase [Fusobacterium perfoetens]